MSEKDLKKTTKPWGSDSLTDCQTIKKIKRQLRKNNWTYLRNHLEIRAIIRVFLHELINKRPDNLCEFGAALFNCNNTPLLITKVNKQLKYIRDQMKKGDYCDYDAEFLIEEKDSTHSLLSTSSVNGDIDAMLRYAMILRDRDNTKDECI